MKPAGDCGMYVVLKDERVGTLQAKLHFQKGNTRICSGTYNRV